MTRFDTFVDRYKRPLIRFLALRTGDPHRAEDLSQEVFLRVFRSSGRHGFQGDGAVSTWLFTIASRCATDYLRSVQRKPLRFTGSPHDQESPLALEERQQSPLERMIRSETARQLTELVSVLDDELREILALRVYGEMSFSEAAKIIGCPVSTAKSRMQKAVRRIRRLSTETGEPCHD